MTFLQSVSSGTACLSKTLYLSRHGVFNSPHIILPIFFICSKSFSKKFLFSACPCSPCAFPISIPPFRNKLSVQDCLYCHYPMNGSPELLISLRRFLLSDKKSGSFFPLFRDYFYVMALGRTLSFFQPHLPAQICNQSCRIQKQIQRVCNGCGTDICL